MGSRRGQTFELVGDDKTYFQDLIGKLRWAIEIGKEDILLELTLLLSQLVIHRKVQMEQVYHIFGYLNESRFQKFDWDDFIST